MLKTSAGVLSGVLVMFSLAAQAFADTPSTVDASVAIAQAQQAMQAAYQAQLTEEASYQALLQQVKTVLTMKSSTIGTAFSVNIKQEFPILQADLRAVASAKTVSQANAKLNTLEKDIEKTKQSVDHQAGKQGDWENEQRSTLKEALADSQHSAGQFVTDVKQRVSELQSEIAALRGSASSEEVKQVVKGTEKLDKAVSKMKSKFAQWDSKIKQHLYALQGTINQTGSTSQPPAPPAPSSATTVPTPPVPPSAP